MRTLQFDGIKDYIEIADDADCSVATTGSLTVSAWMRPDVLTFIKWERSGYVHWMGKVEAGQEEFRMYNETTTDVPPRPNRISFYVFNPQPGQGVGAYFQEPIQAGEWVHVTGIADGQNVSIYKNGVFKKSESYAGIITPQHGSAPVRIGTRDFNSYFLGAIRGVRVWNRAVTATEVQMLFSDSVPEPGLVAENRLDQDIAVDATGLHPGRITGASWIV